MAGVLNKSARQFNLNVYHAETKSKVKVRLAPGLNEVPDETWAKFKGNAFLNDRIKRGEIEHGKAVDEMLAKQGAATVLKSKVTPDPKPKAPRTAPKGDGAPPSLDD